MTLTREEKKVFRVQCSMLHRSANQLQDMPDDRSKSKARAMFLEAEQIRLMLRMAKDNMGEL
jgi:hypothetical protein